MTGSSFHPSEPKNIIMKKLTTLLVTTLLGLATFVHADEKTDQAAKETAYPLTTCIVSGEGLDEMGKPYVFEYEGQEIQLCCKDCKKKFAKDPEKYLKKLEAAKAGKEVSPESEGDHSGHQH